MAHCGNVHRGIDISAPGVQEVACVGPWWRLDGCGGAAIPNRNTFMGVAGWPDVPYAVTTKKLQDGRLVVLVEDDLFQHVAATVIDTGVC